MGQEVAKIVESHPNLKLIGGLSEGNPDPNLKESPELVIDFSLPGNLPSLVRFIHKHSSKLVSGTTGLSTEEFSDLKRLGDTTSVFWSANMSFGVYLMCQLTEQLARYQRLYQFHVEETHHVHKKDKPSGTALMVESAARKSTDELKPTVSHREGEVFGIHSFIANSKNESLEVRHEAFNRTLFAQGAVDAGLWLLKKEAGYYGMDDLAQDIESGP